MKTCEDTCNCFSKCSLRCEVMGEIDGLISFLGIVKKLSNDSSLFDLIHNLQKNLFQINAELATQTIMINEEMVTHLKYNCDYCKNNLHHIPTNFVIPGDSLLSAHLDYARTIARRCERKVVKMYKEKEVDNLFLLEWMNKLSYYLWLLARKEDENVIK